MLAYYRELVEEVLTVPLCVTWIESLSAVDALVAVGQREGRIARRTYAQTVQAAYDVIPIHTGAAMAGNVGDWAILVEPNGFQGSRPEILSRLSRQGRALSVFWNANGDGSLTYAEHGQVLTVVDLVDSEDLEDLPDALSAWRDLVEEDDLRCAALALGETVTGQRLDAEWLVAEHSSAILDEHAEATGASLDEQDRLDQLAYLAADPRVAGLVANPDAGGTREIAALVAETACELSGLNEPLADRVLAVLAQAPSPALLSEVRAEVHHLGQELLAQRPGSDAPRLEMEQWHARYLAIGVLEAAVEEDAVTAARDAIYRIGMLRLDDNAGRRVGALMGVLEQISK